MISTGDVVGGVGRMMSGLEQELSQKGFNINYIVSKNNSNNSSVYELKRNKLLEFVGGWINKDLVSLARYTRTYFLANDLDFGADQEILNNTWYTDADIVHLHNIHGSYFKLKTLVTMAKEKPMVWTLHDKWAITAHCSQCHDCRADNNGNHFTPGRNRYGSDMLWDNSDYLWNKKKEIYGKMDNLSVVCPSEWLAKKVKQSILKDKDIYIINNGVDVETFKPRKKSNIRKELNLSEKAFIIGYVGHWGGLDVKKGGEYFLNTTNYYKDDKGVEFLCIGCKKVGGIEKRGNIYYTQTTHDKKLLSKYYAACDMLLFVSLAENFPLVTLEALSTGLPVVSFDVGGVGEQIKHKVNGYVAKYKDCDDLVRGVEYIRSLDKKSLGKMSAENRKRALEKYSVKRMAQEYLKLYEKIV